jgi:hypothetical protein
LLTVDSRRSRRAIFLAMPRSPRKQGNDCQLFGLTPFHPSAFQTQPRIRATRTAPPF